VITDPTLTSALLAGKRVLEKITQNETNAANPDYSQLKGHLRTKHTQNHITGVAVSCFERMGAPFFCNNLPIAKPFLKGKNTQPNF
jgi:hypothetical protein